MRRQCGQSDEGEEIGGGGGGGGGGERVVSEMNERSNDDQ